MNNVGCNVTHRNKHKATLMLPWVRDLNLLCVDHGVAMSEEVKI
jgi:hypothetical protein